MNYIASMSLSKELYSLTKWLDPAEARRHTPIAPFYSSGFLLRKLHRSAVHHKWVDGVSTYVAKRSLGKALQGSENTVRMFSADTPENALAMLAIDLAKKELLK